MNRELEPVFASGQRRGRIMEDFLRNEDGATSIEYSIIVALIFLAIVASVRTFSQSTSGMYTTVSNTLSGG